MPLRAAVNTNRNFYFLFYFILKVRCRTTGGGAKGAVPSPPPRKSGSMNDNTRQISKNPSMLTYSVLY